MEYEINLEQLMKMRAVFEAADADGSGELDIDEFTEKLGPHLGQNMNKAEIAQLFLKIDADCGGTIDWDEFTNFFFLQRGVTHGAEGDARFCLFPKATRRKEWAGEEHRDGTQRMCCCEPLEKYLTCGRDGYVRVWNMRDLAPVQTVHIGGAWVTDAAYLPASRKLVVASMDRSIAYYNVVRHSFEFGGRLAATGQLGSPQCLAVLEGGLGPQIFYGDTTGAVIHLKARPPKLQQLQVLTSKDYQILHQDHSDWVTQLLDIPDVGLLSSSLDATVKILDLGRGAVANTFALHRKAVRSMAYSRAFSLVASGGAERNVLLWPPKGNINRKIGELAGHSAGVVQVVMADARSQAITLSEDSIIRVWDLRNHGCIQTINQADWLRPEDSAPESMLYHASQGRLLTATCRPALWEHRAVQSDKGHSGRLCSALFNSAFGVVVSGDQSGTILMWNAANGKLEGGFSFNGGSGHKLTALAFDANQRRLLTASEAGELKIWNFNSGAELREYCHKEGQKEITAVAFLAPPGDPGSSDEDEEGDQEGSRPGTAGSGGPSGRGSDEDEGPPSLVLATGWGRGVCIWEDCGARTVTDYRRLRQHDADVLCMVCLEGPQPLVATGDFEGGIKVWDLRSGACISSLLYGGEQWERAVLKLVFLPSSAEEGRPLLLACGQDGLIKVWELQLEQGSEVGSVDGVEAEQPPSGALLWERRRVGTWSSSARLRSTATTARSTVAAPAAPEPAPAPLCTATLVVTVQGVQRAGDCVTAMVQDASFGRLLSGDSSGHVRVWDVSGIHTSSGEAAAAACLRQLWQWRARQAAIVSIQHIPQRDLLLLASDDSTVSMWTLQGWLVGVFGQHQWDLDNISTWQNPSGVATQAVDVSPLAGGRLTPREIIMRTPRKTSWDREGESPGSAGVSPGRQQVGSARGARPRDSPGGASGAGSGSRELAGQMQRMSLPPRLQHLQSQQQQHQGGALPAGSGGSISGGSSVSATVELGECPSPASAAQQLEAAARKSRAARDSWVVPLSVQAHGILELHGVEHVPADTEDIWAHIPGYHGAMCERRSVKASCNSVASKRASEVTAILNKTAPAFGRSASLGHTLSLMPERTQP